jgi:hypothetical protein
MSRWVGILKSLTPSRVSRSRLLEAMPGTKPGAPGGWCRRYLTPFQRSQLIASARKMVRSMLRIFANRKFHDDAHSAEKLIDN